MGSPVQCTASSLPCDQASPALGVPCTPNHCPNEYTRALRAPQTDLRATPKRSPTASAVPLRSPNILGCTPPRPPGAATDGRRASDPLQRHTTTRDSASRPAAAYTIHRSTTTVLAWAVSGALLNPLAARFAPLACGSLSSLLAAAMR